MARNALATWGGVLVGFAIALGACSGDKGQKGSSCSVKADSDGGTAKIVCDDGTQAIVTNGKNGTACTVKSNSDGSKTISCADGTTATVSNGKNGADGSNGADGKNGSNGADGKNGTNGTNGQPGADGSNGSNGQNGSNGADGATGRSAYVVGPGLKVLILSVDIPADLQPVVTLQVQDASGRPLDRTGTYTPGAVSASFVLSYLSSSGGTVGEYVPYNASSVAGKTLNSVPPALANATEPHSENTGAWSDVDVSQGKYSYRFANALPSGYDQTKTHTLAIYASRTVDSVAYVSNPIFDFRPDGNAVTEHRAVVTTNACNQCHNPLAAHGGSRREVQLCITCHVSGMNDPESGNSLDMAQMIHKIHSGSSLPSVVAGKPYVIVGYMDQPSDFSKIVFPQSTVNCDTCHQGGADSDRWKTAFSRAACGSCHDDVSFVDPAPSGMTLHTGGQQTTDTLCMNCHGEGMGPVAHLLTDVTKVHRTQQHWDLRDANTGGFVSAPPVLTGMITGVTGTGPTDHPVVSFHIAVDGTGYDVIANPLDRIRFTFAGPTTDYANASQFTAQGTSATGTLAAGASAGDFTWTSAKTMTEISTGVTPAIPLTGSWAVGVEARIKRKASQPDNTQVDVLYFVHNDVFYFPITDATAVPRRTAVVVENCNKCHDDLAAHGGSRNDPEYCVLCHNANKDATDIPAPPGGQQKLTSSLRLSHMVHRIHTGADGTSPFQIGTNDFSDVLFPGDRRDCTHCHVPDHYKLPLPPELPSHMTKIDSTNTRVPNTDTYMGPTGAACTGCHDQDQTAIHVATQTLINGGDPSNLSEACATCHAAGQAYGIDIVHARPGL